MIESNNGKYGQFGGSFIPELLKPTFDKINQAFKEFKNSKIHQDSFTSLLNQYAGRPTYPDIFL